MMDAGRDGEVEVKGDVRDVGSEVGVCTGLGSVDEEVEGA